MNIKAMTQSPRHMILGGSIFLIYVMNSLSVSAADNKPWSVEAGVGFEYDSNVTADELDLTTNKGDIAGLLNFSAKYNLSASKSNTFEVGYGFSQSLHRDVTKFDLQTHTLTALAKHKFKGFDLGVNYLYINTSLGGNAFLQMHKASPYVSFFATKSVFIRASYSYTDKNLKASNDRDATTHGFGATAFYFMNNAKSYLMASYQYDNLNANATHFDYKGHDAKIRFQTKFPWAGKKGRFRVGGRYVKRNYAGITPSINAARYDKRLSVETMIEIPFWNIWTGGLKYRYTDATSNLPSSDYKENLVKFDIGVKF